MRLFLGEDFGKVGVLFGDRWKVVLRRFMRSRQVLGKRLDRIEMQDEDLIIGVDLGGKAYDGGGTWRFLIRKGFEFLLFQYLIPWKWGTFRPWRCFKGLGKWFGRGCMTRRYVGIELDGFKLPIDRGISVFEPWHAEND